MKVFRIHPSAPYTGGAAYVAANTEKEAINEFIIDSFNDYRFSVYNCTCALCEGLTYDSSEPMLLFDDIYVE